VLGDPLQCGWRSGNAAGAKDVNRPKRRRTRPPCAIFRSRLRSVCRIHPGSAALVCRRVRRTAPSAWDP